MKQILLLINLVLTSTFLYSQPLFAFTYYVDFDNGNDSNSGMSTDSAWRTLPGNNGLSSWGNNFTQPDNHAIDSSHKIPAESIIYIKAESSWINCLST